MTYSNEPQSLAEALAPEPPTLQTIDGTKYKWQKLYGGRKEIQAYHNQRTKVEDVLVEWNYTRATKYDGPLGYGDSYFNGNGYLYSDKTILACCTIEEWGGTFATHHDVRVNFYILTPIIPKPPKVKKQRKSK